VKKVFHFDSPTEKYHADACVISCFDARFELATQKFLTKQGVRRPDPLKIAGGAKIFASPVDGSTRVFALSQVQTSMRLHGTSRVMLMLHSDCGAYGGLQAFDRDAAREAAHYEIELRKAAEFLMTNIAAIQVEGYYLKFDGVWIFDATE